MKAIKIYIFQGLIGLFALVSCDRFLDVDIPNDVLTPEQVYGDERTVAAAVNGLYTQLLVPTNTCFYNYFLPFYFSTISDDAYHTSTSYDDLRYNAYTPTNTTIENFWKYLYFSVFLSNDLITSLPAVTVIPEEKKQQYIGEAKYFRAYSYFVLANFFGDVPLVKTTRILETSLQPRDPKEEVVNFITRDLLDAENGLANSTNDNTKVTKAAVSALLARNYLFHKEWSNAENKAAEVISISGLGLDALENVFLRSGKEAIFKISSSGSNSSYVDRTYFGQLAGNANYLRLTDSLAKSFEPGDLRKEKWTVPKGSGASAYYHSTKYRRTANTSPGAAEDLVLLRLAEQYLIRAEARAQQGKLTGDNGAIADLNIIRKRAGLSDLPETLTQAEVLQQVEKERRSEFFLEEAHRWWDLVRTGRVDAVLSAFPDKKWEAHKALLPIPEAEFSKNRHLVQNPGYGDIK